ncbi:S-adenosyl-L-methionine-dependent methyltransferase [Chytridium lagenaria]|nr:S-adenosyl-L-methionine-dependent methyltransferase [Chytridium lagenaria]
MAAILSHPNIVAGWFKERHYVAWSSPAMTLQVEEILHIEKSLFQDVLVFKSKSHGTFSFSMISEMIAHLPMNAHPNPKNTEHFMSIGSRHCGGDGGVLREVVKHSCLESVTLVEIDEAVPVHPKVNVHIGDGFAYLKENPGSYDSLFQETFYSLMRSSLNLYAWASVPTYPCGNMGFILCCNQEGRVISKPCRKFSKEEEFDLRYYNAQVHEAAFVLPQFTKKGLGL